MLLLVEDNAELRSALREVLKVEGYRVETAATGEEGVIAYRRSSDRIDLVITDMGLPGISGIEVVDRIRCEREDIPVIVISGDRGDNHLRRRLVAKNVHFMLKPFSIGSLIKQVESVVKEVRTRRVGVGEQPR